MSKSTSNEPLSLDKLLKTYLETKDTLGADNSAELEIKFGTRKIKRITKNGFDNVIQQLLSNNFKFEEQSKYYLSIKADDIRTEIHDLKNIQKYCQTNHLPSDYHTEGYNFNEKRHYKIGEDKTPGQFNVDNFNFRVAYSVETNLLSTSEPVKALVENWSSSKKFYRLINRFTMTHEAFPFKIDLSIVRDSLNEKQNFKESNILQLNGKYEIEIEVLNEKISKDETSANLDKMLKTVTKYILSGLQGTNYPVAYNEQQTIIQDYLQLIRGPTYSGTDEAMPKDFIGPSSTTLQIVNVAPVNKDANIVNGMSLYGRDGKFANAACVAGVNLDMLKGSQIPPLEALNWLESLERRFYEYSDGFKSPFCSIKDFINREVRSGIVESSYPLGLKPSALWDLIPSEVSDSIREGLKDFSRKIKGFDEGIIMGLDSKSSSPIQVLRGENSLCDDFKNLYVVGEGSGYSGGIISSGADGIKAAMAIIGKR